MGLIATLIGQPEIILKTGGGAWSNLSGSEQLSVVIPIAYEEAATKQPAAGIVLNLSLAITTGSGADGDCSLDIYAAADNATKDTDALVTNTLTTLLATTPDITTLTYRMDELAPSIIIGLTRDAGTRDIAVILTAYRWYYHQIVG